MKNEPCPPENALSEFVRCHVTEDQAESISEHLSHCERCEETVVGMEKSVDTVMGVLNAPPIAFPFQNEPELQRVVQAAKQRTLEPAVSGPGLLPLPQLEQLRDYRIIEKIGEGGMGAVYRALHTRLNKTVALKVLSTSRIQDEAAISRFQREMSIVGRLQHPNIVQAHDAGEENGQHFLVMEYVNGTDLSDVVRQCGPLPIAAACEVISQAAIGLQYAHEHGLVHRDIKPSNLMLAQSSETKSSFGPPVVVKILDLGLARLQSDEKEHVPELTMDGQVMGTLDYMAPEQGGNSHTVDIRADIYSLGATLYKLLTGTVPFQGKSQRSLIEKLTALAIETPPSVCELRPDVPEALAAIIARMLAKRPDDRFATPAEVASALQSYRMGANLPALLGLPDLISDEVPAGSTLLLAPSTVTQPPQRRSPLARATKWIISAALIAAAVIVISTKEGTVEIETPDGGLPKDVKVEISQDGKGVVDILQADGKWQASVSGGKFHVTLTGGADRFELLEDTLTVNRFGKNVVRLRKTATTAAVAKPETPNSPVIRPELVKPQQAPPKLFATTSNREKPFIVTRTDKMIGEYSSLYGAVSKLEDGEVIEVHANGPIPLSMPEAISKDVHLRAGKGYRPLLVPKENLKLNQGLVIEDCDVDQRAGVLGMEGLRSAKTWQFSRCRFWGGGFGYIIAARLIVEDCIFDTGHGFILVPTQPSEVTVTNCAIRTSNIFLSVEGENSVPVTVSLKGSTVRLSERGMFLGIPAAAKPTVHVVATGNVFQCPTGGAVSGILPSSQWHGAIDWHGQDNVFQGSWYREIAKDNTSTEGLPAWNKVWKQPEQNSVELKALAFNGARLGDATSIDRNANIEKFVDQVTTQRKLTKLGPAWKLVGVGESYLRALAAEGKAVPEDRLRPAVHADGPVVIFRKNAEFKGFASLNAAVDSAETEDVIEIRTDDPIPSMTWEGKSRRLTVRAAPGYSPVINGPFGSAEDHLAVEGLTFQQRLTTSNPTWSNQGLPYSAKGSIERITNCVFRDSEMIQMTGWLKRPDGETPEIRNSVMGLIIAGIPDGQKLRISNSVLAGLWLPGEGKKETGQVEISDSVWWAPDPATVDGESSIGISTRLKFTTRNTLFVSPQSLIISTDIVNQFQGWAGSGNVFCSGGRFLDNPRDGAGSIATLADLQKLHKSDADSMELVPVSFDPVNWRIWRERSTDYQARADGTDFGADIDRLFKAISLGVTATPAHPSPSISPVAPPSVTKINSDRAKPFVVLDADGKVRAEFKFSAEAIASLQDNETLEVYGNGPFKLPLVKREKQSLRIRAAEGYRPRFVPGEGVKQDSHTVWIHVTDAPLVIQGCDFFSVPGDITIFAGNGSSWSFANCKFVMPAAHLGQVIVFYGKDLVIRDSLINCNAAYQSVSLGPEVQLEATNNVVIGTVFLTVRPSQPQVIRLIGNKLLRAPLIHIWPRTTDAGRIIIEAEGNEFEPANGQLVFTELEIDLKEILEWKGKGNFFRSQPVTQLWILYNAKKEYQKLKSAAEWNTYWDNADDLRTTNRQPFGWDYFAEMDWEKGFGKFEAELKAIHQRFPALRETGPDCSLIGSGAAYDRVLQHAAKESGQKIELLPESLEGGPFVLVRKKQMIRGYISLAAALEMSEDGDEIEIRSNGPLGRGEFNTPANKRLTLRAAPGYRPVFDLLYLGEAGGWTLEGLHIRGDEKLASLVCAAQRIANCSFDRSPVQTLIGLHQPADKDRPTEVVNCYFPGGVVISGHALDVKNSILCWVSFRGQGAASLELSRSVIWQHWDSTWVALESHGPESFRVKAVDCMFDLGDWILNSRTETKWQGSRNVYRLRGTRWGEFMQGGKQQIDFYSFDDWQRVWKSDEDSVVDDSVLFDLKKW